jgi:hypothetical protein
MRTTRISASDPVRSNNVRAFTFHVGDSIRDGLEQELLNVFVPKRSVPNEVLGDDK